MSLVPNPVFSKLKVWLRLKHSQTSELNNLIALYISD